jgi:Ca-activated chloride channel family protein
VIAEHLAHPAWLFPLTALTGVVVLALAASRARARRNRIRLLGRGWRAPRASLRSDTALLLALAAIALALLGPRWGERVLRVPAGGVDVVFLVDVSRSMDARDVPPSRLDRARRGVEEILGRLHVHDRAALAAFGSRGVLLTPLTPDRDALLEFLSALDTDLIRPAGSRLGEGVRAALTAFARGSDRSRVLFVLSDGEDRGPKAAVAADAVRNDVRILAAALGSDVGASVPDHDVPLRDATGRVVVSRRNAVKLASLAEATGGEVFVGDEWGSFDFGAATAAIRRDAGDVQEGWVERRVAATRVAPFAALALVLLCLEGLPLSIPATAGGWAPVWRRRARGLAASLAVLLAGAPAFRAGASADADVVEEHLRASPGDPRLLIALGLARSADGEPEAASRAFSAAALLARDPAVASVAYYDLGVTALSRGDLEGARDAFFDALALTPDDERARFNLEWTLRALEVRPPPDPPAPPPAQTPPAEGSTPNPPPEGPRAADRSGSGSAPGAPPDEAMRRRILSRVKDDPTRSLRAAAREQDEERRRAGPVW